VRLSFISSALPEEAESGAGFDEFPPVLADGADEVLLVDFRGGAVVPVFGILFSS
jgi:hypothetical protein